MSIAVRLLIYPLLAYVIVGAVLYFQQDRLLFPAPKTFEKTTPADVGLRFENLEIPVGAAAHVHGWWIPAGTPSERVILVFHGNAEVLEDMVAEEIAVLRRMDTNLLLIDYRGYASAHPSRIAGLVYMDSTADPTFDWKPSAE